MDFVIEPHVGIWSVRFGMSRDEVEDVMDDAGSDTPRAISRDTEGFNNSAFRVSFGDQGLVSFIEISSRFAEAMMFNGRDVFDLDVDELLALIGRFDEPDPELSRPPQSYTFSNLILTLWGRDKQYDHRRSQSRPVFAAVGLGSPTYLAAIRAIRRKAAP